MALMPSSECGRQVSTMAFTGPDCGAPVDAPRPPAAFAPTPAHSSAAGGRGNRLLLAGAVVMVVLGGVADATVRHLKSRPAADALPAVGKPGPGGPVDLRKMPGMNATENAQRVGELTEQLPGVGMPQRLAARAIDSLNDLHMDSGARKAEILMRVTLADVAQQQEIDVAAFGSYTSKFSALGVTPRTGVQVEMTGGGQAWSATATHRDLPGMTCTTGAGPGQGQPGQVFCTRSGA